MILLFIIKNKYITYNYQDLIYSLYIILGSQNKLISLSLVL